jgi:hypothetical protein
VAEVGMVGTGCENEVIIIERGDQI